MNTVRRRVALRVAVGAAVVASTVALSTTALAETTGQSAAPVVYQTTPTSVNGTGATGTVTIVLVGKRATIVEHVSGLGATFDGSPFPHVQHIHIEGKGTCPPPSADRNHDGLIDTVEGIPYYGSIGTSLTVSGDTSPSAGTALNVAPKGGTFDYKRVIDLDPATLASLKAGTANVVIHGIDPSTLSDRIRNKKSELVPSLPLYATSPALCGFLKVGAAAAPTPSMAPATATPAQPTFTG